MRFFVWVDFQYEMIALFLGSIALILTYLAWGSYARSRVPRSKEELEERGMHERSSGHDTEKNPVAPFLIYVYLLVACWSAAYLLYVWGSGSRF